MHGDLIAEAVQFVHGGETFTVKAKREVILSAGAIQSPALLQLSGIGDPAILNSLGIKVLSPLVSVGRNLQEQTMNSLGWELA